jgi:hypothetical protein
MLAATIPVPVLAYLGISAPGGAQTCIFNCSNVRLTYLGIFPPGGAQTCIFNCSNVRLTYLGIFAPGGARFHQQDGVSVALRQLKVDGHLPPLYIGVVHHDQILSPAGVVASRTLK